MADDDIRDKEPADDLDPAFDSIDATMKDPTRKAVTVTPETLAQIVSDAVAKAITAYEESRGATPESEAAPGQPAAVPLTPRRTKIEQLKDDMGFDEIQFEGPPQEAVETKIHRELSSQMGVHDFEFEDAPGPTAEPDAPTRIEADAIAGWALTGQDAAPPAMPDVVDETPAPAVAEETADADPGFDWVAEELKRLEAEETPTALDLEPVRVQPPEAVDESDRGPRHADFAWRGGDPSEHLARDQTPPPAAPKPEVRETRKGLAGWFRSALGDQSPGPKPSAAVPVPEPAAPVTPAAAPPPEPAVAAPPPLAARIEEPPRPRWGPAAASKPMTPEAATEEIHFTFDPILPVPPRLPRDPKEPPKKTSKSGTFL
jgi:hypothetical protein